MRSLLALYKAGLILKNRVPGVRALFICTPATAYGGGQQYLYRILERIEPNRCNIIFAFPTFKDSIVFKKELHLRGAGSLDFDQFQDSWLIILAWVAILWSFTPSFIHVNGYNDKTHFLLTISSIFRLFLKCKICVTQHLSLFSESHRSFIENTKNTWFRIFSLNNYRWIMRDYYIKKLLLSGVNCIIFVNEIHKEIAQNLLGLKNVRLKSIINGVDTEIFRPGIVAHDEKRRIRRRLNVKDGQFLIIGIGNLIPQKRFDLFIYALAKLVTQGYPLKGLIVGSGPLASNLEKLVSLESISDFIIFAGYSSNIPTLLNVSDLFLMTSEDEGLPYALLEARGCGLPSVATCVGGIREVIRNGIDGYVVQSGDLEGIVSSIKKILDDSQKRAEMGILAREDTIKRFSLSKMQQQTIDILENFGL